jgi:hypothetical protein
MTFLYNFVGMCYIYIYYKKWPKASKRGTAKEQSMELQVIIILYYICNLIVLLAFKIITANLIINFSPCKFN